MDNEYPDSPSVQGAGAYDNTVPTPYQEQAQHEMLHRALGGKMIRERTKLERLKDAKQGLEAKLAEVNNAIRLMEENPKIAEIIHAMERAGV